MVKHISGVTRMDKVDMILAEQAAEAQRMLTPRYDEDADLNTDSQVKPCWERLSSGTSIRVWWSSADEWYDCKIIDWRVGYDDDRQISYTHRCQYAGGIVEHDLSTTEFDVVENDEELNDFAESAHAQVPESLETTTSASTGTASEELNGARSRLHSWLAKQEKAEDSPDRNSNNDQSKAERGGLKKKAKLSAKGSKEAIQRARTKASSVLLSPLKKSTVINRSMDADQRL